MPWAPDYIDTEDLKNFLRIDEEDTDDDDLLAEDITTASHAINTHCKRQFGNAAGTRSYKNGWYDSTEGKYVFSIDDLMVTDGLVVVADGVTLDSEDYELLPLNALADGKPYTHIALSRYASRLEITADPWGWLDIPDSVKKATKLQASRFFNRRNSPYGVAGSPDVGSELRLLAKVDPDVAVALKGFSRLRRV